MENFIGNKRLQTEITSVITGSQATGPEIRNNLQIRNLKIYIFANNNDDTEMMQK